MSDIYVPPFCRLTVFIDFDTTWELEFGPFDTGNGQRLWRRHSYEDGGDGDYALSNDSNAIQLYKLLGGYKEGSGGQLPWLAPAEVVLYDETNGRVSAKKIAYKNRQGATLAYGHITLVNSLRVGTKASPAPATLKEMEALEQGKTPDKAEGIAGAA